MKSITTNNCHTRTCINTAAQTQCYITEHSRVLCIAASKVTSSSQNELINRED